MKSIYLKNNHLAIKLDELVKFNLIKWQTRILRAALGCNVDISHVANFR